MKQFNVENHDENLLSRWSRRKQLSTLELKNEDRKVQQKIKLQGQELLVADDKDSIVVLTDEDMPAIESLHEESDFSAFMSSGVSDELRNMALRKLFTASSFNLRDGLDEYDEDYTSFEKLGDIITSDMKHQIEMEAKKKLQEETDNLPESVPDQPSTADSSVHTESEINTLENSPQIESQTLESDSPPEYAQQVVESSDTQSTSTVVNNE